MKQMKRTFIPGDEWLYIKIYAGVKMLDNILLNDICYIVVKLKKLGIIKKWFFIRYADPDPHIRVRFLVNNSKQIGEIITLLYRRFDHLVKSNNIWKLQIDTYNRELERYGVDFIEDSEFVFYKDSECALNILKQLRRFNNENYRWMIALIMIDSILSDFFCNMKDKLQIIEAMNNSFMLEFGFNKYNSKQFNSMFRDKKSIVESVLNKELKDDNFYLILKCVAKRSKELELIIRQLKIKLAKQKTIHLENLLQSYIHMMINRLFISKNRIHELVLYDFMRRYYNSEMSKIKYNNSKVSYIVKESIGECLMLI